MVSAAPEFTAFVSCTAATVITKITVHFHFENQLRHSYPQYNNLQNASKKRGFHCVEFCMKLQESGNSRQEPKEVKV